MSGSLHRPRRIASFLALALGVALALSFAPAPSFAAAPEPGASEVAELPVLLLMTEPDEFGDAVARAIATELNDVDVQLEALALDPALALHDRIEAGEQLVRARGALGLVWIEARPDGLVVHLIVADVGMLRRPIVGLEERRAAMETAAVVVRHFVLDLLAGRPIGLTQFSVAATPSDEDPASKPTPALDSSDIPAVEAQPDAPPPGAWLGDRGHFRLIAGYVGQAWIRERAWENGVEVGAGWRFANGAHLGFGAGFSPAFETELVHPGNRGVAQLRVRQYPIALAAGYQHVWQRARLALDAQLRVGAEILERGVFDPNDITPRLDRPVIAVPTVEPRLALDYLVIPPLAVFVAVGLRTSLVRVDYRVEYSDDSGAVIGEERPLQPRIVAPVVLAGLDMYF